MLSDIVLVFVTWSCLCNKEFFNDTIKVPTFSQVLMRDEVQDEKCPITGAGANTQVKESATSLTLQPHCGLEALGLLSSPPPSRRGPSAVISNVTPLYCDLSPTVCTVTVSTLSR